MSQDHVFSTANRRNLANTINTAPHGSHVSYQVSLAYGSAWTLLFFFFFDFILLALEFINLFKELWSPSGNAVYLCCQGVSSHCMLGNLCAEQEDKLWNGGFSSILMHIHFKIVSLLCHWGQQEQCGSFSSHFCFSALLVPKEPESWWDAGLPRQVKAALPLPKAFWGTNEGLLYLSQAAREAFNACVKLVTLGGVISKFLELKAHVLQTLKG